MATALYGLTGVLRRAMDTQSVSRIGFCAAWLCPSEFGDHRLYELHQESSLGHPEHALPEFQRALRLNSASAYAWADLAETFLDMHDEDLARYCVGRAVAAAPNLPAILTRAANVSFTCGNYPSATRYLSRILGYPDLAEYYPAIFLTYSRMNLPITQILALGIPKNPWAAQSFLRFTMEGANVADVESVWDWISNESLADEKITGEYLDFLIHQKQERRAAESWAELNRRVMPEYGRSTWIYNGGFEQPPKPSRLDWQIQSTDDVQASRCKGIARDGGWSLRLAFQGKANADYHQVFQQTVLFSGKWRLQALVRTEGITTDRGVSVRLYDATHPERLGIKTESLTGTHNWTALEQNFNVGPQTSLVQVEVVRQPSEKLDNKIVGTAWIDSVTLRPVR